MSFTVDLNLDAGESLAEELALFDLVTSVNVACGGHAGDAASMSRVIAIAEERGLAIGAHPSFPDRKGFGRRRIAIAHAELVDSLTRQIESLAVLLRARGLRLSHVKPHGALYNLAAIEREFASAVIEAVRRIDASLPIVGLGGSRFIKWCELAGHKSISEGFADRRYEVDGTLRGRQHADALIQDLVAVGTQARELVEQKGVQTICVHGDSPKALEIARSVREHFSAAKIEVCAWQ